MTKTTLLAATFALALGAGSAYAENTQLALGSVQPAYPVSIANRPSADVPAASGSSVAPLSALLQDWDRAGFVAPTKPAQAGFLMPKGPSQPAWAVSVPAAR